MMLPGLETIVGQSYPVHLSINREMNEIGYGHKLGGHDLKALSYAKYGDVTKRPHRQAAVKQWKTDLEAGSAQLTKPEALKLLRYDLGMAEKKLQQRMNRGQRSDLWSALPGHVRTGLTRIAYELTPERLTLPGRPSIDKMWQSLHARDYTAAGQAFLDSRAFLVSPAGWVAPNTHEMLAQTRDQNIDPLKQGAMDATDVGRSTTIPPFPEVDLQGGVSHDRWKQMGQARKAFSRNSRSTSMARLFVESAATIAGSLTGLQGRTPENYLATQALELPADLDLYWRMDDQGTVRPSFLRDVQESHQRYKEVAGMRLPSMQVRDFTDPATGQPLGLHPSGQVKSDEADPVLRFLMEEVRRWVPQFFLNNSTYRPPPTGSRHNKEWNPQTQRYESTQAHSGDPDRGSSAVDVLAGQTNQGGGIDTRLEAKDFGTQDSETAFTPHNVGSPDRALNHWELRRTHEQLIGAVADYYGIRLKFGGNWDDDAVSGRGDSTIRDFSHVEIHDDERKRLNALHARTGQFYEGRGLYQAVQSAGFPKAMEDQRAAATEYTPLARPKPTSVAPTKSEGYGVNVDEWKRNP